MNDTYDLFNKRKSYEEYYAEYVQDSLRARDKALDFMGVVCTGEYAEDGCPLCKTTMKDSWGCRYFSCLNPECGMQIMYDSDFMLKS